MYNEKWINLEQVGQHLQMQMRREKNPNEYSILVDLISFAIPF